MGWKKVKEHYRIDHIVKVSEGNIHIGSPYIGDIVVVRPDGKIIERDVPGRGEIKRYQDEIDADPALFSRLYAEADLFEASIPVYGWNDDGIIETFCEEIGWPNVTHDGDVMYENRYSPDREQAVKWALKDARLAVSCYQRNVGEAEAEVRRRRDQLAKGQEILLRLEQDEQASDKAALS